LKFGGSKLKPLWEGAISFGLILIPVKLYKATDEQKPVFHLVREKDLCPITYTRVCKYTGEEVPYSEIARGYQYQQGSQVILHDDDFRQAYKKRSENIEIISFVNEAEIDTKYFEQPYYIEPQKGASKVYALLNEALKKTKKAGIATYVFHNIQHLGVLKSSQDMLMLNQIRFESDFRQTKDLNIPALEGLSQKEIDIAIMLIEQLSAPFEPSGYNDTYRDEIAKMIDEKIKTGKVNPIEKAQPERPAEVIDLLEKLKSSLEEAKKKNVS